MLLCQLEIKLISSKFTLFHWSFLDLEVSKEEIWIKCTPPEYNIWQLKLTDQVVQ